MYEKREPALERIKERMNRKKTRFSTCVRPSHTSDFGYILYSKLKFAKCVQFSTDQNKFSTVELKTVR